MSNDKVGLVTLRRQLQEQQELINELRRTQAPSPAPTSSSGSRPSEPSFAVSLYQVKAQIADSKTGHATDAIESIYNEFKRDMPVMSESLSELGKLVEYAVDFTEKYAPLMMQLLEVFVTDTSPFKLNTCIMLIILVIPPTVELSRDMLEATINMVVKLKNEVKAVISQVPKPIQPKKKRHGLAKLFH